jgi:transcriptional regulator
MGKLAFSSANPLYQQLMDDIKLDISNQKYRHGDKIPSETELAEIYNVSRITVRRAVSELCDEGYLAKHQGKGTFVTPPKITRKIMQDTHVHSFTATCAMSGMQPGGRTVGIRIVPSRQEEQHFLKLPKDSNVIYLQRIRTADGDPVMLENTFLPSPEFDSLLSTDLTNRSLNETLRQKYSRSLVVRQTTKVEVSRASPEHAQLLNITPGDPLFFITAYFLDERDNPIAIARHYFLASRFIFYF